MCIHICIYTVYIYTYIHIIYIYAEGQRLMCIYIYSTMNITIIIIFGYIFSHLNGGFTTRNEDIMMMYDGR